MPLEIGQVLTGENSGAHFIVKRKLGEGTQGEVYLVGNEKGEYACKWYKPAQATEEQRAAIRALIRSGPPKGPAGSRFIWPLDLVTAKGSGLFGYLMRLIDTSRFASLGEIQAGLRRAPGYRTLCVISYRLANSYRALHLNGYCYRDISDGNLMFDPATGDVLICDNDNVGVNRQSSSQVWGTMEFMAPELILGKNDPSTETDLHALAVLLFSLWCWHHPFHGAMEYSLRVWDIPAKRRIYGEDPVFIFDPHDSRNRPPSDPAYSTVVRMWEQVPRSLREMFIRAFTIGLKDPAKRVTEGEWQREFLQLEDAIVQCPHCHAENFQETGDARESCWHCGAKIPVHPRVLIKGQSGDHYIVLSEETIISKRHITRRPPEEEDGIVLGKVVRHPSDPGIWGIRNLTGSAWSAITKDGVTMEIPPQKAVPLNPGIRIRIEGIEMEIAQ